MKVTVFGVNYDNKGSWAMLLALERYLNKKIGDIEIVLMYDAVKKEEVNAASKNYHLHQAPLTIIGWTKFLVGSLLFRIGLNRNNSCFVDLNNSDLVIDLSGFALTEDFSKNSGTRRSLIMLFQAISSKILAKKYVLGPQAIGPITRKLNVFIVNSIFLFSSKVFFRGELRVPKLYSRFKLVSSPDLTSLVYFEELYELNSKDESTSFVLVNPNSRIYVKKGELYITEMHNLLNFLIIQGKRVVLTPNEIRSNEFDDLDLCQLLKSGINNDSIVINNDVSLVNLFALIDNSEYVIASRFHIMMFCLIRAKRVLVSSWSQKYLDIMKLYEQQDYCFEDISNLVNYLEKDIGDISTPVSYHIKRKIQKSIEKTLDHHLLPLIME